jgi:hypothetical protein
LDEIKPKVPRNKEPINDGFVVHTQYYITLSFDLLLQNKEKGRFFVGKAYPLLPVSYQL